MEDRPTSPVRPAEPKVTNPITIPKTLKLSEITKDQKKSIPDNKVINMTTVVLNKMELKKIPKSGSTGFKVPMTETFLDYKKSSKHTTDTSNYSKSSNNTVSQKMYKYYISPVLFRLVVCWLPKNLT
jgi:hypothetical protein